MAFPIGLTKNGEDDRRDEIDLVGERGPINLLGVGEDFTCGGVLLGVGGDFAEEGAEMTRFGEAGVFNVKGATVFLATGGVFGTGVGSAIFDAEATGEAETSVSS